LLVCGIPPELGADGIIGVLKDDCGNIMSFELSSTKARFLGYEDLHEPEFSSYERLEANLEMYTERIEGVCTHDLYIYPSSKLRKTYTTTHPIVYTTLVAAAFVVVIGLFIAYDWTITRRQNKTIVTALTTQAIVTSLFPEEVGKRMIHEAHNGGQNAVANREKTNTTFVKNGPAISGQSDVGIYNHPPTLAELYPETTVMFADLVGFTAWSSLRAPEQVFRLLEAIYSSFDEMARRRRVFKVSPRLSSRRDVPHTTWTPDLARPIPSLGRNHWRLCKFPSCLCSMFHLCIESGRLT
jgi:Adenylate and Guanylate cyclase catalytic domain